MNKTSIIFTDSTDQEWTLENLKELVEALHKKEQAKKILAYYFDKELWD